MNKDDILKALREELAKGAEVEISQSFSEELKAAIEEMKQEMKPEPKNPSLGLTEDEKKKFSVARAVRGIYRGWDSENKFEQEVVETATRKALSEGNLQSGGLAV